MKALLRTAEARTVQDLRSAIRQAFTCFTSDECRNYLAAAGYDAYDPLDRKQLLERHNHFKGLARVCAPQRAGLSLPPGFTSVTQKSVAKLNHLWLSADGFKIKPIDTTNTESGRE